LLIVILLTDDTDAVANLNGTILGISHAQNLIALAFLHRHLKTVFSPFYATIKITFTFSVASMANLYNYCKGVH
jgi:ADP-ribosylglycohydrolase